MLGDRDPNGLPSGRNSRASNVSGMSRAPTKRHDAPASQDLLSSAAPGVMSMLRTSTEMGNIGGLTGGTLDLANVPCAPQRRGASSRLSTASSLSTHSNRTSRHHRQRPSSSSAARHSFNREAIHNVPQYVPDTISPTMLGFSGSSSLVPTLVHDTDSHRSHSMTHTSMQPMVRLSTNRSLGSLQNNDHHQRPKSPYHYPAKFRRVNQRPASPAWSDIPGSHQGRLYSNGGQGHQQHPAQTRLRMPSDTSLGYQDSSYGVRPRPSRGPSPVYYQGPHPDIPPIPPLHQHYHPAVEQARMLSRSIKGSVSSGSTNMRADSDAPSSDWPLPPTPKDGSSVNGFVPPNSSRMMKALARRPVKEEISSGPLYYDYSEQFDREEFAAPNVELMQTNFVNGPGTIMEDRKSVGPTPKPSSTRLTTSAKHESAHYPAIAELPASPVGKRITRHMVREALGLFSTTGEISSCMHTAPEMDRMTRNSPGHSTLNDPGEDEPSGSSSLPTGTTGHRRSIQSQAGTSLIESSTVDFAVRYSIPAMTGTGFRTSLRSRPGSTAASPRSPERSSEDGMSELLAGYQHTDSKQGDGFALVSGSGLEKESIENRRGTDSSHAQKPSDDQSFKSCTDVSKPQCPTPNNEMNAKSFRSATAILSNEQPLTQEADVRSLAMCQGTASPCCTASVSPSRLPSSATVHGESAVKRSIDDLPPSSPAHAVPRKAVTSTESRTPAFITKFRASSKPSIKQGSISVSESSSTWSVPQQPPSVPPRDSSASKEAQRFNAVGSFLMRRVVPTRFMKERKQPHEEVDSALNERQQVLHDDSSKSGEQDEPKPPKEEMIDRLGTPEKAPFYTSTNGIDQPTTPVTTACNSPIEQEPVGVGDSSVAGQHFSSSQRVDVPEASSNYSSQGLSANTRQNLLSEARSHSLPETASKPIERDRRDSQTTTHLVWPGHRHRSVPSGSASEPHIPSAGTQESTTTDLRLSAYRYGVQHYLPDLKEESHEDSSLNTSASNLKHSHFRFPHGIGPSICASVDDAAIFSRRSSAGSFRKSNAAPATGLPSIEFSQANLLDKLHDVLGIRFSRSSGDLQHAVLAAGEVSPQRSASACDTREQNFNIEETKAVGRETEVTQAKAVHVASPKRMYSPEIVTELEQLTIPSVGGLTLRISEMMPSVALKEALQEYHKNGQLADLEEFPEEAMIMEHALKEVHNVHPPSQKRSSARLRAMPGSSKMLMVDDDVYENMSWTRAKGDGSQGHEGDGSRRGEAHMGAKSEDNNVASATTHNSPIHIELQVPSPAVLRPRSNTIAGNEVSRVSVESGLSSRRSLKSLASTPTATDTRPWNFDKNYPWATTSLPSVDISLPPPAATRHSPRRGPSHLRNTFSDASTSTFASTHSPVTSPFDTSSSSNASRQTYRHSIFARSKDQAHGAGDRYPTSALSPPTAIFRDNLSTCDISDDEDFLTTRNKSKLGLVKRFSTAARNNTRTTPRATRSRVNPAELASPATAHGNSTSTLQNLTSEARAFTSNRHTFRDAQGLTPVAYRRRRVIESIKRWWHKGGELIKTISRRGNGNKPQDGHDQGCS